VGSYTVSPALMVAEITLSFARHAVDRGGIPVRRTRPGQRRQRAGHHHVVPRRLRGAGVHGVLQPDIRRHTPLHADDPRQVPFISAEQQFENRWIVEALVQANQTVVVPLQFASAVTLTLQDVDALFPA
jgi:hypothetical protein